MASSCCNLLLRASHKGAGVTYFKKMCLCAPYNDVDANNKKKKTSQLRVDHYKSHKRNGAWCKCDISKHSENISCIITIIMQKLHR